MQEDDAKKIIGLLERIADKLDKLDKLDDLKGELADIKWNTGSIERNIGYVKFSGNP